MRQAITKKQMKRVAKKLGWDEHPMVFSTYWSNNVEGRSFFMAPEKEEGVYSITAMGVMEISNYLRKIGASIGIRMNIDIGDKAVEVNCFQWADGGETLIQCYGRGDYDGSTEGYRSAFAYALVECVCACRKIKKGSTG